MIGFVRPRRPSSKVRKVSKQNPILRLVQSEFFHANGVTAFKRGNTIYMPTTNNNLAALQRWSAREGHLPGSEVNERINHILTIKYPGYRFSTKAVNLGTNSKQSPRGGAYVITIHDKQQ